MIQIKNNNIILKSRSDINQPLIIPMEYVFNKIYTGQDRMIIIGGSYADGLATAYSDLDILVFTEHLPETDLFDIDKHNDTLSTYNGWMVSNSGSWSTHDLLDGKKQQIEITYYPFQALHDAIKRLEESYSNSFDQVYLLRKPFKARKGLTTGDKELLHRLNSSICIDGEGYYQDLKSKLSIKKFCWVNYLENQAKYPSFKDIMGLLHLGHFQQAYFLFSRMLMSLVKSLLHLNLFTNTKSKWALDIFQSLPPKYTILKEKVDNAYKEGFYSIEKFENSFDLMDELFVCCMESMDSNFGADFRKQLYDINVKAYQRRTKLHPEIERAHAFSERHTTLAFKPTRSFLTDEVLQPSLLFK